jgi:Restriction endonuclease
MALISRRIIQRHLHDGDTATTAAGKGRALEELIAYLFGKVPGIIVTARNQNNTFGSEELDVAFWNERQRNGCYFLPNVIIVECKNWSRPIGCDEVTHFDAKIRRRGLEYGILVAANGITGDAANRTAANHIVFSSLSEGRKIIVISRTDIEGFNNTDELIFLLKQKITSLYVEGSVFS